MSTPASFKNHPIHPILIVFPLGLWTFSFVCDLIRVFVSPVETWATVALYCIGGGIAGALLASIPGFIDYLSIRDDRIKKIATKHLVLNLIAVLVFAVNFFLRIGEPTGYLPVVVSAIGLIVVSISGWLGGSMVYEHGVAVSSAAPKVT